MGATCLMAQSYTYMYVISMHMYTYVCIYALCVCVCMQGRRTAGDLLHGPVVHVVEHQVVGLKHPAQQLPTHTNTARERA